MTVNVEPDRRPLRGVITSSCSPLRVLAAGWPFTSSREIAKPRRSRSKLERSCVARAVMTAVPESWLDDGSYESVSP